MKNERESGKQLVCLVVLLIGQKFPEGRDCLLHSVVLEPWGWRSMLREGLGKDGMVQIGKKLE